MSLSHPELVEIGAKWLEQQHSAKPFIREQCRGTTNRSNMEIPDGLAIGGWGVTYLLEAKMSHADFLADKEKPWRVQPAKGMGTFRYLICPAYVIESYEVADTRDVHQGWGLLYVNDAGEVEIIVGEKHMRTFPKNVGAEFELMRTYMLSGKSGEHNGKARGNGGGVSSKTVAALRAHLAEGSDTVPRVIDLVPGLSSYSPGKLLDAVKHRKFDGVGIEDMGGKPLLKLVGSE